MWYYYNHIRYEVKIYFTFVNTKHVLAAFFLQQVFRQYGSATDVTSCNEQRYTDEEAITYYGGLGIQEQPASPPVWYGTPNANRLGWFGIKQDCPDSCCLCDGLSRGSANYFPSGSFDTSPRSWKKKKKYFSHGASHQRQLLQTRPQKCIFEGKVGKERPTRLPAFNLFRVSPCLRRCTGWDRAV